MSIEAPNFNMLEGEGSEAQAENIDSYADEGVNQALSLIKERYENSSEEKNNLPFHNVQHTEGVIRRTEIVLSAIREADPSLVSERDIKLGRLAAAYHDTIQRSEENKVTDGQFTKVLRRRFAGANEKASAEEGVAFMNEVNSRGKSVFSENDKDVIREAVDATVPSWDPVNKTVMQPKLADNSSLIARAVALADLGNAGMDGGEVYINEGKALFREEQLDIIEALKSGDVSPEQQEYFKKRMVSWHQSQVGFARGRQQRLEAELQAIPEAARDSVATLFSKFDESVRASEEFAHLSEAMGFEEIARDMGY